MAMAIDPRLTDRERRDIEAAITQLEGRENSSRFGSQLMFLRKKLQGDDEARERDQRKGRWTRTR